MSKLPIIEIPKLLIASQESAQSPSQLTAIELMKQYLSVIKFIQSFANKIKYNSDELGKILQNNLTTLITQLEKSEFEIFYNLSSTFLGGAKTTTQNGTKCFPISLKNISDNVIQLSRLLGLRVLSINTDLIKGCFDHTADATSLANLMGFPDIKTFNQLLDASSISSISSLSRASSQPITQGSLSISDTFDSCLNKEKMGINHATSGTTFKYRQYDLTNTEYDISENTFVVIKKNPKILKPNERDLELNIEQNIKIESIKKQENGMMIKSIIDRIDMGKSICYRELEDKVNFVILSQNNGYPTYEDKSIDWLAYYNFNLPNFPEFGNIYGFKKLNGFLYNLPQKKGEQITLIERNDEERLREGNELSTKFTEKFKAIKVKNKQNSTLTKVDKEIIAKQVSQPIEVNDKLYRILSKFQDELIINSPPKAGGKNYTIQNKIKILGRERLVRKDGRTNYILYKNELIKLTDAKKLDKKLQTQKAKADKKFARRGITQ